MNFYCNIENIICQQLSAILRRLSSFMKLLLFSTVNKFPGSEYQYLVNFNVRKRVFGNMRPARIQSSLRICAVWLEPSLGEFWIAKEARFLHLGNEYSDCTERMCSFVGFTCQKVCFLTIRKHAYSNVLNILQPKTENVRIRNSDIFLYFCSKHWLWVLFKPPRQGGSKYPQYMYFSKIR